MNKYVVDASVAIKWFIDDDDTEANIDQATQLLIAAQRGDALFLQPPHWVSEIAAVLARLTPKTASRSVTAILALEFVKTANEPNHYQQAISLAFELDHHLFDRFYHAIALESKGTLITADERYFKKAKRLGSILMLNDFDG